MEMEDPSYTSLDINEENDNDGKEQTEDLLKQMIMEAATVFPKPFVLSQFSNDQVVIRLNTKNREEFLVWLKQYQKLSYTTFRVLNTRPKGNIKVCYKAQFRCQHDTLPNSHRGVKKPSEKHTNCEVRMLVTIAAENANKTKPQYIRDFPTVLKIRGQHNHGLDIALKFREPDESVKKKLIDLFQHHGPAKAHKMLKLDLMSNPENNNALPDRAQCPDYQYVYRLHRSIMKKKSDDRHILVQNSGNLWDEGENLKQELGPCEILEQNRDNEMDFEQVIEEPIERAVVKREYECEATSIDYETALEQIEAVCDKFRNLVRTAFENNPEAAISALEQFEKNLMNIKTDHEFLEVLSNFGDTKENNYRNKKKIKPKVT